MPNIAHNLFTALKPKKPPKKAIFLLLLLVLVIVGYQNQKNIEQQGRYETRQEREKEQCIEIFKARFGDWPASISEAETLLGEKIDASRAATAREFDKYRLDRCIADRISREEASETEKARELEIEARTSCAESARRQAQFYEEFESKYRAQMRVCMETRGFEYRE